MNKLMVIGFFCLLFINTACAVTKSEIDIAECESAPKIDGVLNDACWKNVPESPFFVFGSNKKTNDTKVLMTRDKRFIYLGFVCDNPNMHFLDQHGVKRDDPGIFKDDSVEIFITRKGLKYYFQYALNFANVRADRRVLLTGGRDLSWSFPWISATKNYKDKWTAEVAIPLMVIDSKNPGQVTANFLRNKINVSLDKMGSKNSESREYQFWSPVKKSAHEPESFGVINGLLNANLAPAPFLVDIEKLKTGEMNTSGDKFSFKIDATLLGMTPVAGKLKVEVIQELADGPGKCILTKTLSVPPRCRENISLNIPVSDFSKKNLYLQLRDQKTGMLLGKKSIAFKGNTIQEAYPEFSFYSFEKELRIKAVIGLSDNAMKNMSLILKNKDGKIIAKSKSLSRETILASDAGCLKIGKNVLTLSLVNRDDKIFGTKLVCVMRLEGRKNESKTDYFRRIAIFKGRPYFPYGVYDGAPPDFSSVYADALIKSMSGAKMNTLISIRLCNHRRKASDENVKTRLAELAKANINYIQWGWIRSVVPSSKSFRSLKSREEKERILRGIYEKKFLGFIKHALKLMKDQPNFLAWYGLDEPNLGHDWEANLYVQKLFHETIKKHDPYHVMFGLYARRIPRVPEATGLFDILGYDIYTYPNWKGRDYSKICHPVASQVTQLNQRAAETQKPIWCVLQPGILCQNRCPRALSGQELLCQGYSAVIYGAKGIIYFNYFCAAGDESWKALKVLGKHISVLSPAILNYPVKQSIKYASGSYDAASWKVSPAPVRLFRFPDGGLVAVAVNSRNCPVDLSLKIKGLASVSRMFDKKTKFSVRKSAFKDKLEPYGIRAYSLAVSGNTETLEVSVSTKPYPQLALPAIRSNQELLKEAQNRKNKVLNPSFELQKIKGIPDFYKPYRIAYLQSMEDQPNGYVLDTENPKFGKVSLRITQPVNYTSQGVFGVYSAGGSENKSWVFSFYAKALSDNATLRVYMKLDGQKRWRIEKFKLSRKWKRYSVKWPALHKKGKRFMFRLDSGKQTVWLDGLQLEEGNEPTEFSE